MIFASRGDAERRIAFIEWRFIIGISMAFNIDDLLTGRTIVRAFYKGLERDDLMGFRDFLHPDFLFSAPAFLPWEEPIVAGCDFCKRSFRNSITRSTSTGSVSKALSPTAMRSPRCCRLGCAARQIRFVATITGSFERGKPLHSVPSIRLCKLSSTTSRRRCRYCDPPLTRSCSSRTNSTPLEGRSPPSRAAINAGQPSSDCLVYSGLTPIRWSWPSHTALIE